jgi:hypothetical protein
MEFDPSWMLLKALDNGSFLNFVRFESIRPGETQVKTFRSVTLGLRSDSASTKVHLFATQSNMFEAPHSLDCNSMQQANADNICMPNGICIPIEIRRLMVGPIDLPGFHSWVSKFDFEAFGLVVGAISALLYLVFELFLSALKPVINFCARIIKGTADSPLLPTSNTPQWMLDSLQ